MPSGAEVEDSVTSSLNEMLKKKGLNSFFKKTYSTVSGRKEPDITIEMPSGIFLLEAKLPPAGLPQAMSQAGEYKETIGQTEHVKGIFAVVYTSGIKKDYDAWFAFDSRFELEKFKNLEDLAGWIAQKVIETPKPLAPVNTQKIIEMLDQNVALINQNMQAVHASEIEEIFGGRDFFSTVLDYEQESRISDAALKNAASYLLLNQILFYQILSNEVADYQKINARELKEAGELHTKYFSRVLKDDYQPIFGFNVAAIIRGTEATSAVRTAIQAVQLLSPQMLSHDLLGKIFHNLIPLSLRKVVAAYYTNSEAGELLADLAIEKKNDKVIDPACGSGTLLVAAYNRKKSLYGKFEQDQHTRFLENEIFGADIMPFAAHLAAVNLALQAPLNFTNTVNIAIRDSTELAPGVKITAVKDVIKESYQNSKLTEFENGFRTPKPRIKKGAVDLGNGNGSSIKLPKFDVVIMNPPFTRFQRIPPRFKEKLQKRFDLPRYKNMVHGQLGLHGYFLLLADKLLAPNGRLAAVLPITTISLESFYGIVSFLLREYSIEHAIVSTGRAAFSENTSLREMLLVARKHEPLPEHRIKFTFIHASPEELSVAKAHTIAENMKVFDTEEEANDDFYIRQENQVNLLDDNSSIRDLYRMITLHSPQLVRVDEKIKKYFSSANKFERLGDVEERENWKISENPRGVEEKGYYCLSLLGDSGKPMKEHDVWLIEEETETLLKVKHRFNCQAFRIPKTCVMPQFRRFSGQERMKLSSPRDYLVVRQFPEFENFVKASALADQKRAAGIRNSIREGGWERFVLKNSARVFGFYRGNVTAPGSSFLSIRSSTPTFAGPGGSWVFQMPDKNDSLVQMWLNSSIVFYLMLRDRKETEGGFMELDKYVFENLPYPKKDLVDPKTLADLEREVSKLKFPSLLEQFQTSSEGRRMIDHFFLEHAGMPKEEQDRFLKLLYETMSKELLRLKGVMGK
ncbi:MAG: N-6 DNA methylase [Candidatus Aenigmarchaeota archaeon]|nr:N-6 DNA methylase [Candidatus Aenigmarchaeota archaeon]